VARAAAAAVVLALTASTGAGATESALAGTTCDRYATLEVADGYLVGNNAWNSTAAQCVTTTTGTAWTVSASLQDQQPYSGPGSYPSIYAGCAWHACTPSGGGLPVKVGDLASARSSWSTSGPISGSYDTTYDLWFGATPSPSTVLSGAELMVWLNYHCPLPKFNATVTIGGAVYDVSVAKRTDFGHTWNRIAYVRRSPVTSVSNFDLRAFVADSVARGQISPSWFLSSAFAGFEIWQGGIGLRSDAFSFSAAGAPGAGPQLPPGVPDPPPSPDPGPVPGLPTPPAVPVPTTGAGTTTGGTGSSTTSPSGTSTTTTPKPKARRPYCRVKRLRDGRRRRVCWHERTLSVAVHRRRS
jgi:cellulose 1,4-beta-cellobiosidase